MAILHTHAEDDECCGKHLDRAIWDGCVGVGPVTSWMCPECGCEWLARDIGMVRHWEPNPFVAVII